MIGSTRRRRSGVSRVLRLCGIGSLLVATSCGYSHTPGDPAISADVDRSSQGVLEGLTVEGKSATPNGPVLITLVMAASGGNASPYIEETIQADANGEFRYERRPPPCPQPLDYQRGSWTSVVARDMTSGISASEVLEPGVEPDCRGS